MPILVVDDDEMIRAVVIEALETAGYRALGAADGEEALAMACRERPSLVLLDVWMPRRDGWSVASALAAWPDPPPVVVFSASHEAEAQAQRMGLRFLGKPFDFGELFAIVAQHDLRAASGRGAQAGGRSPAQAT